MARRRRFRLRPHPLPGPRSPLDGGPYLLDRLRAADLVQVARLERQSFPEPLTLGALLRLWLRKDTCFLVARRGRQVAGYIGFHVWGPIAHTISMAVHPAHRRRGLATAIQRAADQVAARLGARWFTGEVRKSNAAQLSLLLERLGWQAIGVCRGFFGDGEDAVVVWHWLEPPDDRGRRPGSAAPQAVGGQCGALIHAEGPQEQQDPAGAEPGGALLQGRGQLLVEGDVQPLPAGGVREG